MPVDDTQRQAILAQLRNKVESKKIAAQVGVTLAQVSAIKAHVTMGRYDDQVADGLETEADVDNVVEAAFGLERDLQTSLRRNIEQLEPGLTITDGGKEQKVASGRIDITARDQDGATVIIELKIGQADREAVGQLLAYMGDFSNDGARVRGLLVAGEFASRAVSAARVVPNLRLVKYGFRFTFETVTWSPT